MADDRVPSGRALYEAPPHLVDAYNACRQQVLVETFLREVASAGDVPDRLRLEDLASRLFDRYTDDVINDLLIVAERIPAPMVAAWVRAHFSKAIGQFGVAIRASAPESFRHGISQVLQIAVLTAEHRLNSELSGWLGTPEPPRRNIRS